MSHRKSNITRKIPATQNTNLKNAAGDDVFPKQRNDFWMNETGESCLLTLPKTQHWMRRNINPSPERKKKINVHTQLTFTCSESTIETLENDAKYVQS